MMTPKIYTEHGYNFLTPAKESDVVIDIHEQDYLGEGVHDIWINGVSTPGATLWENLLGGKIKLISTSNRSDVSCKITNEMIIADLLWQLVSFDFPEKSAALSGFILNNRHWPKSSQTERLEEIYSYIDIHQVSKISHSDICHYKDAGNISWIADITPYSLPRDKSSYDITCFLDDFMWFNNETKTILIISASEGYESEVREIEDFANAMLKNPTVTYGEPLLPGIEVMAIFIYCIAE